MKIGLIDVDGRNFPNLALMRISAYHKAKGDDVCWWWSDFEHYDIVYKSKVFSNDYTKDIPDPLNADKIIKGGSGYCISLENGKEVFDKKKNNLLPAEIERCFPDYSIYPQYDFAVSITSRGCPNNCGFCHVCAKEGIRSIKVANVSDFWNGQKIIVVLDPNITACKEKRDLMAQYADTGAYINYSQGLDIRFLNDEDIADLNRTKLKDVHFAWDDPNTDLRKNFERYAEKAKRKVHGAFGTVYVLTNYNSTLEQDLYRIYTLRDLGYDPDVRIYDKPHAPKEIKRLQRWCNNRVIFKSCRSFDDYNIADFQGQQNLFEMEADHA